MPKSKAQELVALLTVALVLTLVRHKNHLLVELANKAGKLLVQLGNAHANIHHKKDQVRFVHSIKNLGTNTIGEHVNGVVRQKTAGIDYGKFVPLVIRILVMAITGDAITVAHHRGTPAEDAVKQGGLTHVRASNDAYDG